jgi:outer membrane protein OmpA-like peptidoglycan-associated protein
MPLLKYSRTTPELKFDIQGYTDNTGDAAHKLTFSQQQADAVKEQLINMVLMRQDSIAKAWVIRNPRRITPLWKAEQIIGR